MTVYDNIAFGLKIKKLGKLEIDRKVCDIAAKVDLSDEQLAKAVSQLSGGSSKESLSRALLLLNQQSSDGFAGIIESLEYYGLYIKYYIRVMGQILKVVEKNNGVNIYKPGENVKVVLSEVLHVNE